MVEALQETNNETELMNDKAKEVALHTIFHENRGTSLSSIAQELNSVTEKYRNLEELLVSRDATLSVSIKDLFTTVKTLSHNQTILENKLDDALKNQMNTDVLVNSINERLNKLSTSVGTITKTINSSESSNSLNGTAQLMLLENNSADHSMSRPPTVRRGPGRPRKDGTSAKSNDFSNNVQQVKVTLPTGAVQLSKSKRYFTDPSADGEYLSTEKEEQTSLQGKTILGSAGNMNAGNTPTPIKRKRGRPPKKRTVETVIINENNINEDEKQEEEKLEEKIQANTTNNALSHSNVQHIMNAEDRISTEVPSSTNSPPPTTRSPSSTSLPSNAATSTVATLDSANFSNHQEALNKESQESPIVTTRIITPFARKKLLGASNENDNIVVEMSSASTSSNNVDADTESISNVNRQQRELEKRRDSREKMLVNMKYNDREKAKSFMESNKKLLKAMREEERRKRMTALIYDTQSPYPAHSINRIPHPTPSSAPAVNSVVQIPKTEETAQLTKKIGISSILNDEETNISTDYQDAPNESLKRSRSLEDDNEDFDEMDDDSQELRNLRRRRGSGHAASPRTSPIESPTNNEISDGSTANRKNESQVSLLLASPIELLCRDGFFYRRNTPNVPITTGSYLEFKFKPKQDELVSLRLSQKDFADRTRQNRMNAHFLKPEIESETEVAFKILSKTTLTEKYVNSLEYFLMEFRWENKLVGLGLKLRESKRTWQRRKALFALFEFWRDQSREKRNFINFTILHAVKEMENYRIFINRSVSWFYNHITLLKMILYDLCDNVDTQWREWMFPKGETIPVLGIGNVNEENVNEAIDNVLTLDFLDDGSENNQIKSSKVIPPPQQSFV